MTYASVTTSEQDNSQTVTPFPGVYGAIAIPDAVRGVLGKPVLVTSAAKLLAAFSMDGVIKPGSSQAYQQANLYLSRGNKLWTVKPANSGYAAACVQINASTATAAFTPVTGGLPGDPDAYTFATDGLFLVYAAAGTDVDPGTWGNRVSVVPQAVTRPEFAGHFNLLVYLDSVLMETWKVSRQTVLDASGNSAYIEDVLKSSSYVAVADNLALDATVLPKFPSPVTTLAPLTGGLDGTATTSGQIIQAYDLFYNTAAYPLTMLLDHGDSADAVKTELLAIAATRGDCIALLSVNYATMQDPETYAQDAVTWLQGLGTNSSYGAVYGPTTQIYDKFNDKSIFVGSSGFAAAAINYTYTNFELWYPPAGYDRGVMLTATGVQQALQPGDMSLMYDAGINPIRYSTNGILIWGQKTLSFPPSARDRVNVRLLLCVIKPAIQEYLEGQLFNLNDPAQRLLIVNMLDSYMAGVQGKNGVYAYEIVSDSTNNTSQDIDNYTLNVLVRVQPAKGMEFINQVMAIDPTGVSYPT